MGSQHRPLSGDGNWLEHPLSYGILQSWTWESRTLWVSRAKRRDGALETGLSQHAVRVIVQTELLNQAHIQTVLIMTILPHEDETKLEFTYSRGGEEQVTARNTLSDSAGHFLLK